MDGLTPNFDWNYVENSWTEVAPRSPTRARSPPRSRSPTAARGSSPVRSVRGASRSPQVRGASPPRSPRGETRSPRASSPVRTPKGKSPGFKIMTGEDCAVCGDMATAEEKMRCCRQNLCSECRVNLRKEECPYCRAPLEKTLDEKTKDSIRRKQMRDARLEVIRDALTARLVQRLGDSQTNLDRAQTLVNPFVDMLDTLQELPEDAQVDRLFSAYLFLYNDLGDSDQAVRSLRPLIPTLLFTTVPFNELVDFEDI